MQFQADILGIPIQLAAVADTTVLGAAFLAGLAVGMWQDTVEIAEKWRVAKTYEPSISTDQREVFYRGWKNAVNHARNWAKFK
jgi:glycerol kinase